MIIFSPQEVLLAFSRNITGHPSPPDMMACSMWKHTVVEFISFSCTLLKNKVTSYSYLKNLPYFLISTYIKSYHLDNSRSEQTFYMFLKRSRKAAQEFCGMHSPQRSWHGTAKPVVMGTSKEKTFKCQDF